MLRKFRGSHAWSSSEGVTNSNQKLLPLSVLRSKEFSDAPRFQLWTDALCFRAMAKEAANNYLSSMCVRNAILSAWTTLEMACCDALGITKLERDFKESLHNEFDKRNIPRLDFGSGSWQEINTKVKGHRNRFMHSGVSISNRFPPVSIADEAISTIRKAVHEIYAALGKQAPRWIDDDQSAGWQVRGGGIGVGMTTLHMTLLHEGARPETLGVVKVVLVNPQGEEKASRYLPPTTSDDEVFWWVEDYLGKLNVPFKAIRVYRGQELVVNEDIEVR
jgi:hypothetical protein